MFGTTESKPLRRRIRAKWSKGEKSINQAIEDVAAMGDSPELIKAVEMLDKAQQKVADYCDRIEINEDV